MYNDKSKATVHLMKRCSQKNIVFVGKLLKLMSDSFKETLEFIPPPVQNSK